MSPVDFKKWRRRLSLSLTSISSSTFIDNNEPYKQISCVEHFYMHSNIIKNMPEEWLPLSTSLTVQGYVAVQECQRCFWVGHLLGGLAILANI